MPRSKSCIAPATISDAEAEAPLTNIIIGISGYFGSFLVIYFFFHSIFFPLVVTTTSFLGINKFAKLIEQGIVSSKDLTTELFNILKSKRDEFVFKMKLTSKDEFEVLSKRVENLENKINKLEKKKVKKVKQARKP